MTHLESAKEALKNGDPITASVEATRAIEENDRCYEAYLLRSQISMNFGDKNGAAEDLKKAISIHPELLNSLNGEYKSGSTGC